MSDKGKFENYFSEQEISILKGSPLSQIKHFPKVLNFIKNLWLFNFTKIGFPQMAEDIFNTLEKPLSTEELVESINHIFQNKDFKKQAKKSRKNAPKMSFTYSLIKEYLEDGSVSSFLDFGCGKQALLRRIAKENRNLEKLYGYDPRSQPETTNFDSRSIFISREEELEKLKDIDIVFTSFVFHHLTEKEIQSSLETINKILKLEGKFIFIEESFIQSGNLNLETSINKLKQINYSVDISLTNEFNNLSTKEKFLVIYLNDILINLKNLSYMPWTFQYKTMEEWRRIIEQNNFKCLEEYYLGIPDTERLKQGLTSLQVFNKSYNNSTI